MSCLLDEEPLPGFEPGFLHLQDGCSAIELERQLFMATVAVDVGPLAYAPSEGFEPPSGRLGGDCSVLLSYEGLAPQGFWAVRMGGGIRTHDRRFWRPMLFQLSYTHWDALRAAS